MGTMPSDSQQSTVDFKDIGILLTNPYRSTGGNDAV
jgi:hypothetical protein